MKYIKSLIIFLTVYTLSIFNTSCSTGERSVTIKSLRPADINIPNEIKALLILDRTSPKNKTVNIVEGVLTGEAPSEDRAAAESLTEGMRNTFNRSQRYTIKLANEKIIGNSLTSAFPPQLAWDTVHKLCTKYNCDGLVAIELLDSDFIITNGKRLKKKSITENGITKEINVDEYYANGINNLTLGLRLYNPKSKQISDQKLYTKTGNWTFSAPSKALAIVGLINKSKATRQLCAEIGASYAYRISPMTINITRKFRGKSQKTPALEIGSRYADVAQWEKAIGVWKDALPNARAKDQAFLSYNIAIAYEVLKNQPMAIKWAEDSYTLYGNKDAAEYRRELTQRIKNQNRAINQLK